MKFLKVFAGVILVMATQNSFAGDKAGNGGGGYICPNAADSEFLDLFEARTPGFLTPQGLKIPDSNDPAETQIERAFAKLNPASALYRDMIAQYKIIRSAQAVPVPNGFDLAWPRDEQNKYAKSGCQAKGLIIFHDEDRYSGQRPSMDFDRESLEKMPNTQQAAAWVHETIYRFLRQTVVAGFVGNDTRDREILSSFVGTDPVHDSNSIVARKVVGHLFSDETQSELESALASLVSFYPRTIPQLQNRRLREFHRQQLVVSEITEFDYFSNYVGQILPRLKTEFVLNSRADVGCLTPEEFTIQTGTKFYPLDNDLAQNGGGLALVTGLGGDMKSQPRKWSFSMSAPSTFLRQHSLHLNCPVDARLVDAVGNVFVFNLDADHSEAKIWFKTVQSKF